MFYIFCTDMSKLEKTCVDVNNNGGVVTLKGDNFHRAPDIGVYCSGKYGIENNRISEG
jgi:hypothetical protein